MIPKKFNPCKKESSGKWWADAIYKAYEVLNYGASSCACCSFFRGAILSGILFFTIGYLVG